MQLSQLSRFTRMTFRSFPLFKASDKIPQENCPSVLLFLFNEIHEALNYVIGEGSQIKGRKISLSGGMSDGTGVVCVGCWMLNVGCCREGGRDS